MLIQPMKQCEPYHSPVSSPDERRCCCANTTKRLRKSGNLCSRAPIKCRFNLRPDQPKVARIVGEPQLLEGVVSRTRIRTSLRHHHCQGNMSELATGETLKRNIVTIWDNIYSSKTRYIRSLSSKTFSTDMMHSYSTN